MHITLSTLRKLIREELSKFDDTVDVDQLSYHDVINDPQGPEDDAWDRPDWIEDTYPRDVEHKRPSVAKRSFDLMTKAGMLDRYGRVKRRR